MSNEIYKNIDSYICDLDNDLSMTNDQSYLGESLDLAKADELQVTEGEQKTIDSNEESCNNNSNNRTTEYSLQDDCDNAAEYISPHDQFCSTKLMDDDVQHKIVENDPFIEKNQSLDHEFIINSPFSKPSVDFVAQGPDEDNRQTIFGDSYVSVQDLKSATIDDFKGLKTGMLKCYA